MIRTDLEKGATLVFYAALFPRLARYMPHVRQARDDLREEKISQQEYDKIESLERNHVSSISTAHSNIGYLLTLVINLSVLLPLQGNPFGNNLALCLTNSCESLASEATFSNPLNRLGHPRHLVVYLPATSTRPQSPQRPFLPHMPGWIRNVDVPSPEANLSPSLRKSASYSVCTVVFPRTSERSKF